MSAPDGRGSPRIAVVAHEASGDDQRSLSAAERARAAAMGLRRRRRFVVARTAARSMLAEELGILPAEVALVDDGPRPTLAASAGGPPWALSISHGRGVSVVVLSRRAVGVDLEPVVAGAYDPDVARRVLHPDERRWIEGEADRDLGFLACWTRKEAVAKLRGTGLDDEAAAWAATPTPLGIELRELDVAPGHVCSLAMAAG